MSTSPRTAPDPLDLSAVPFRVQQALTFLENGRVWHLVSRNPRVTSCRDAAARRRRLGGTRIPLYDELRSLYCRASAADRTTLAVLCHCRGSERIDLRAVERLLASRRRLHGVEVGDLAGEGVAGLGYGTINPFSEPTRYLHVFDEGVLTSYTPPRTMMTNAGEATWGIEFRIPEVIDALRAVSADVVVGPIAWPRSAATAPIPLPVFGILTGNGPNAGMALWRHLNASVQDGLEHQGLWQGVLSLPRVVVESIPDLALSDDLDHRGEEAWEAIRAALARFTAAGVTHVAIACPRVHDLAAQVRTACGPGVAFVSLGDVLCDQLGRSSADDLTLVSIEPPQGRDAIEWRLEALGAKRVDRHAQPLLRDIVELIRRSPEPSLRTRVLNRWQAIMRTAVHTSRVLLLVPDLCAWLDTKPHIAPPMAGRLLVDPLLLYGRALADQYVKALTVRAIPR